jgi:ABC-type phosphate/phosphonate transport system ATPase subunit
MDENTGKRIAIALERIATAIETIAKCTSLSGNGKMRFRIVRCVTRMRRLVN